MLLLGSNHFLINTNIVFYLPKAVTSRQSAELFKTQILGPQTRVIFQASRDR